MVRAPLLPIEAYLNLGREETAAGSGSATLSSDPRIRAALAVGSSSLFDSLSKSEVGAASTGKLLRYMIRMSSRPTPYGLFAGVGLAGWDSKTDLTIASNRPRTRTRPDMEWLTRLALELEAQPDVRKHLRYYANPRLYEFAGRLYLPEAAPTAGTGNPAPAVSIRATNVARRALALARTPISHQRLTAELADASNVPIEKAEGLIENLWRQTILLTELRPPLTGQRPAQHVLDVLRDVPAAAETVRRLQDALKAMAEADTSPIEESANIYRALAHPPEDESTSSQTSCQVDMALNFDAKEVSRAVAEEAVRAAELLLKLTPLPAGLPHLDNYKHSFEARYGASCEVPLLELLDPNFGLGMPAGFGGGGGDPRKAALRQRTLHQLAIAALRERRLVVEIDKSTMAALASETRAQNFPQSLELSLFVVASSAAAIDAGDFQVVVGPNLGATAAGRNLGRFADLLGAEAALALRQVGEAESAKHPGCVSAEVVYLPRRFRSANVAIRPHSRDYEIVLGTSPGVSHDRVIPLDELVVGIRNARFYLRWSTRDVEVLPYAGHMLNAMQAPDVCRFLDDLRHDGEVQISTFDWGSAAGLPVLPRVQVGRVVLSPAQWRLDAREETGLSSASPGAFKAALDAWRTKWQVPRYVYLSFADNRLLLDLDCEAQANELATELRRLTDGAQVLLQEALPGPDHAWAAGPGGHYITELVVPLVSRAEPIAAGATAPARPSAAVPRADRFRLPGTDWLYAKLYAPRTTEDDLLTGPVAQLCARVVETGVADSWFFIRYADPDPHLRLRFHGTPESLVARLLPMVSSWANDLVRDGADLRLCFDTYEREVGRYGGRDGIVVAEEVFASDSSAVIEMLRLVREKLLDLDTTCLAVLSIDDLLAGLGCSEAQRTLWYRESTSSRTLAGDEYRKRKEELRYLLSDPDHIRERPGGDALSRVFAARRERLAKLGDRLDALEASEQLSQPKTALLRSYVHLHCNRLLADSRSMEEPLIALLGRARYGLSKHP